MRRVPLDLNPVGAYISAMKIYSLMIYPDNIEKRSELCVALVASGSMEEMRRRSTGVIHLEDWMYDDKEKGIRFIFHNKKEILERKHLGFLASGQMWRLWVLRSHYESTLADATGNKKSLENDRRLKPSARDMRDLFFMDNSRYEEKHNVRFGKYSDKELRAAWKLMEPVAHFWAAEDFMTSHEMKRRLQESKEALEKENGTRSMDEEISRQLGAFLRTSKSLLFQCADVIPHGEESPVFDTSKAFWIDSENDEWLGKVEPFQKMDGVFRGAIKRWRDEARGAAHKGKKKALAHSNAKCITSVVNQLPHISDI